MDSAEGGCLSRLNCLGTHVPEVSGTADLPARGLRLLPVTLAGAVAVLARALLSMSMVPAATLTTMWWESYLQSRGLLRSVTL